MSELTDHELQTVSTRLPAGLMLVCCYAHILQALLANAGCIYMHILKVGIISQIWLRQAMHIYLKNNRAKFHLNLVSNDGASGILQTASVPTRTTRWVAIGDQFLIHNAKLRKLLRLDPLS